jgi:hypothetical protein
MRPSKSTARVAVAPDPALAGAPAPVESRPSRRTAGKLVVNQPAFLSFLLARISGGRRKRVRRDGRA